MFQNVHQAQPGPGPELYVQQEEGQEGERASQCRNPGCGRGEIFIHKATDNSVMYHVNKYQVREVATFI